MTNKGKVALLQLKSLPKSIANSTVISSVCATWAVAYVCTSQTTVCTLLRTTLCFVRIGLVFVRVPACVSVILVTGKNTRNAILKVRTRDSLHYSFKNAQSVHQSEEILSTINMSTTETAHAHVAVFAVLQPPYQRMTSSNHAKEIYMYIST